MVIISNNYIFVILIKIFIIIFILINIFFINSKIIISVIIPTYNREKIILNSIKSVLNQTFNNIEIIIIDDCSTDNTTNLIKNIKNNRIKYIKLNKTKGASYARNIGISIAKGKYISFQDSDDIYHFDKLEKQMKNIYKSKSDLDFCKVCVHINKTNKILYPNNDRLKDIKKGNLLETLLSKGNFISTQSILVKKSFVEKYLFDTQLPRLQDYDLVLRIIPKLKVSFTNKILVDIYRQKDSISIYKEKLLKSIVILLNKNYSFNLSQKTKFLDYLKRIQNNLK